MGSLPEAPGSLAAAARIRTSLLPSCLVYEKGQLPLAEAAVTRQQALTGHVLQAKSFLGAQGMDKQVSEGQVRLTFKELVSGEEITLWERYLAVRGDQGPSAL